MEGVSIGIFASEAFKAKKKRRVKLRGNNEERPPNRESESLGREIMIIKNLLRRRVGQ